MELNDFMEVDTVDTTESNPSSSSSLSIEAKLDEIILKLVKNGNAGTKVKSAVEVPSSTTAAEPQVLIYLSSKLDSCVNKSHDPLVKAIQDYFGDGLYKIRSILYFEDFTRSERTDIVHRHNIPHGTRFARTALVNPDEVSLAMINTKMKAVTCMCCLDARGVVTVVGPDSGHGFRIHALGYKNRRSVNPTPKSTVSQKTTRKPSPRKGASCGKNKRSQLSSAHSIKHCISEGMMKERCSAGRSASARKSRVDAYNTCMTNAFPHSIDKVKGAWCTLGMPREARDQSLTDDLSLSSDNISLRSTIEEDTIL